MNVRITRKTTGYIVSEKIRKKKSNKSSKSDEDKMKKRQDCEIIQEC